MPSFFGRAGDRTSDLLFSTLPNGLWGSAAFEKGRVIYDLQRVKKDFWTFAYIVVSDKSAQSAQANLRRQFTTTLDFVIKVDLLKTGKIHKSGECCFGLASADCCRKYVKYLFQILRERISDLELQEVEF